MIWADEGISVFNIALVFWCHRATSHKPESTGPQWINLGASLSHLGASLSHYLELIENVPLRNIMTMGAKFRETPPCKKNKLTYLYRDAIEQLTKM